ncbi:TraB/GumN family protein [Thermomonas sp.]|uniref:TraB/GumN family protein n=1 Tax=Thermomonas sp. TaxID=1971895 RepID=UPI002601D859|nr:TraB/GumN family protein [Thermomonas sp.]
MRTAVQPQADQDEASARQEAPAQPQQGLTRGVRSRVANQGTADVLHPEAESDRGVLFRITAPKQDGSAPRIGYLFGTIHFGTPEEQDVDYATLGRLLDGVAVFVNEADVDTQWDTRLDGYRWLPARTSLDRLVGADAMAKARELLPDVQVRDLQRMRPWMVLALLEARGEQGGDDNVDIRLQRIAGGMGKRLVHLESLEDQLRALDCVPTGQQAQVLAERLQKPMFLKLDSAEAMAAYRARDLDAWLTDVDRMDGLSDAAKQIERRSRLCLLEDRNARWIDAIEDLYRRQSALVAVGALHLAGPDGLIARLRRDGFKVEVIPLQAP